MKIALYSDLHSEFNKNLTLNIAEEVSVVVLAGDIIVNKDIRFLKHICSKYPEKQFLWVAGNHEFYGGDVVELTKYYNGLEISNLKFLSNEAIEIDGVVFHGSTLWTGFSCKGEVWRTIGKLEAERNVSDFYKISVRGSKMSADIMEGLHKQCLQWLSMSLQKSSGKRNVVITHFPPLVECRHPKIPEGILDTYFNNDLIDFVDKHNISHWLYGHNHWSDDFNLLNTRLISNQKGYPQEKCGEFIPSIVIEV